MTSIAGPREALLLQLQDVTACCRVALVGHTHEGLVLEFVRHSLICSGGGGQIALDALLERMLPVHDY